MITDEQIAALAYRFWEQRGRPSGSPEVDWYRAVETLGSDAQNPMRLIYTVVVEPDTSSTARRVQ